jgi:CubicO group peptidase (beta-lactamase class C family)
VTVARRTAALPLALALVVASPATGQEVRPIARGQTLPGVLGKGARHDFTLRLARDFFVFGEVDQIGVDVVVTILGPDGAELARFDGRAQGLEPFQFSTGAEGSYTVRVAPVEEQTGAYAVTVSTTERVARDPAKRVDQIMARYAREDGPGVVVGVVRNGKIAFQKAYGMANIEYGVRHRVDTPTNIGSVSKPFTAMAILLLQADGLLSLDDDVRTYIPELPDFGATVTLKNMLNHVTGYRDLYNTLEMSGRDGEDAISRDEAIRIIRRQPELQAQPNTEYNYNNTGFILLATIVERVSGKSFPDFMAERIFQPLGMTHTRVKYVQGEVIPGASRGYVPAEGGGWRGVRDVGASAGAGGIYTTFADMTRWMANFRDATVGGREAIRAMTTRNVLANGDTTLIGLGLGINRIRGLDAYTHDGADVAHRTWFSYFPEIDGGVFISSNASNFPGSMDREITELFFASDTEPQKAEAAGHEAAEGAPAAMPAARLEAVEGDWMIITGGTDLPAVFTVEDGTLFADVRGSRKVELTATSDSTVAYAARGVTIGFHFQADGSVDSATFTQGRTVPMRRLRIEPLDASALEAFVGRYYSRELESFITVGVVAREGEEPHLTLERLRGEPIELTHGEGTLFRGAYPFDDVAFVRAANGDVTGFTAGNGATKGVHFRRW